MKGKLMIHYSISFILACLTIFMVNILFMRNNIYNAGAIYNYYPEKLIYSFKNYIYLSEDNRVLVNEDGIKLLESNDIGIQILDDNNKEVFQHNKPNITKEQYSNVSLIDIYSNEKETMFLDEKEMEGINYTYLVFFNPNDIKRVSYTYDARILKRAHRFPTLITINVILIIIISFLYTVKITKPINNIIDKILGLFDGKYSKNKIKPGIYFKVEECLNQLADRLDSNEKEREKLEGMREEWISNISHDIKTPLTSIMGNAEIMADIEYDIDNELRVKCCNTIISKSEYIKTLVEDLNLSTRLKNNTLILNKKRINIVSLLRHVVIDIMNDEKYNAGTISFNYSDEEILLEVDEQLIKRVFINIIINSYVHNTKDIKINVDVKKVNDIVEISLEDNGKGVSEEELNNIFKRYYRGTNTSKKTEGSGLGMAIAHDIIKVHGADITAKSKLGKGLKINIEFS